MTHCKFYFISEWRQVFKVLKMNITTESGSWSQQISLIPGGVKIWKCNFKVHFKGPHFGQVINPCEISIYQTLFGNKTFKSSLQIDVIIRFVLKIPIDNIFTLAADFPWMNHFRPTDFIHRWRSIDRATLLLKIIYKGSFKSFVALYADRICSDQHFVENCIEKFPSV